MAKPRKRPKRRTRVFISRRTKPGAPPGSIVPKQATTPTVPRDIQAFIFSDESCQELTQVEDLQKLKEMVKPHETVWINVDRVDNVEVIRGLGELYNLHSLALEDVVNVHQRPKVDLYDDVAFIVLRMPELQDGLELEQFSLFLGKGFVITFQEKPGDCLDPIRERLRRGKGRIRKSGADYLAYTILDATIDHYFPVLERYGEMLEDLEHRVMESPSRELISEMYSIRHDLLALRRALWPTRDAMNVLTREDEAPINEATKLYVRDCYDHVVQLIDIVEACRDLTSSLMDVYLSALSHRMNEIMKMLTLIATIFIPLGFIASLYGMNFDRAASPWNMPELGWAWGYPFALGLMAIVALVLLLYFYKRGWLGRDDFRSQKNALSSNAKNAAS